MDESRVTDDGGDRSAGSGTVETNERTVVSRNAEEGRSRNDRPQPLSDAFDAVRTYLLPGESPDLIASVSVVSAASQGPSTVALTDGRLLVVGDDGSFTGIGYDRIVAVGGQPRSDVTVRGTDYRFLIAVGALVAVAGFVGILAAATTPVTPVLSLVALGGVLAVDAVRANSIAVDDAAVADAVRRLGGTDALTARIRRAKRRINEFVTDDAIALTGAGALVVAPFIGVIALDASLVALVCSALTIGSVALVVYGLRHAGEFDGFEIDRHRYRIVTVSLADGSELRLRTDGDARLDRELAALVQASRSSVHGIRSDGGQ